MTSISRAPIEIRKAGQADAALISQISRQTFYETFAEANTPENMALFMAGPFSTTQLEKEPTLPGFHFYLAYSGAQACGYLLLKDMLAQTGSGNAVELSRIYVLRSFQKLGIGRSLLKTAEAFARDRKVTELRLGVWEHNSNAIAFYTGFGFKKIGMQEFVLGNDIQHDWLMSKTL